ncbi:hypothetical protein EXIGLDRAFT_736509, partial [Exidia glandulosa HHB12029]
GQKCTWKNPRWMKLPESSGKRTAKEQGATTSPAKRRRVQGPPKIVVEPEQLRQEGNEMKTMLRHGQLAHVKWTVVQPIPSAPPAPVPPYSSERQPSVWLQERRDFEEVLPAYSQRTPEGLLDARNILFLDGQTVRQDDDGWNASTDESDPTLTLTFTRAFERAKGWAPSALSMQDGTSPGTDDASGAYDSPAQFQVPIADAVDPVPDAPYRMSPDTDTPVSFLASVNSSPSNKRTTTFSPRAYTAPPLLQPPTSQQKLDDLAFPDDIGRLYFIAQGGVPVLLVCSNDAALRPCEFPPGVGVGFIGFFVVRRIDEKILRGRGIWNGVVSWRVTFAYAFPPRPGDSSLFSSREDDAKAERSDYGVELLPSSLYVPNAHSKGWACSCGLVNVREWAHEWVCGACGEKYPAPLLGVTTLRQAFVEHRAILPDLELQLPPSDRSASVQAFIDGSIVVSYTLQAGESPTQLRAWHIVGGKETQEERRDMFAQVQGSGILRRLGSESELVPGGMSVKGLGKRLGLTFVFACPFASGQPFLRATFERAMRLCDLQLASAPDTSVMAGVMWLDRAGSGEKHPMVIRFPSTAFRVSVLALGADVSFTLPNVAAVEQEAKDGGFAMKLLHGDICVVEKPATLATRWTLHVTAEHAAMLIITYTVSAAA